jgi:hypothetical protein
MESGTVNSYLVVGMQKSGTSAIYAMLKSALASPQCCFEPSSTRQIDFLLKSTASNRLAKILYRSFLDDIESLNSFDFKIHIVRDPRDIVISYLLYWPLLRGRHLQTKFIEDFVELLEKKEADPRSVGLRDFSALMTRHGQQFMRPRDFRVLCKFAFRFHRALKGAHTLKYDSLILGDLNNAEQYLGLTLPRSARVGAHISYNERQKALGSWRDWFTPEDVADYLPALSAFIDYFGFDSDWTLNETPNLASEYGSNHIRRSVAKLTRFPAPNGELRDESFYSPEYLSHLESAQSDGIESAMIELALAHLAGFGVERSLGKFKSFLLQAYQRGNVTATIHLSVASRLKLVDLGNGKCADQLANEGAARLGDSTFMRRAGRIEHFYASHVQVAPQGGRCTGASAGN